MVSGTRRIVRRSVPANTCTSSDQRSATRIARQIALAHPCRVIGLHISGTNPLLPPRLPEDLDADEAAFVEAARA
jgi:hypothetical protein